MWCVSTLLSLIAGVALAGKCTLSLQRQISSTRCGADGSGISNSGCFDNNNSMWVESGCRGYFICDGQPNVYCASGVGQRIVCPCVSGPPPPPQPPSPAPWPECGVSGIDPRTGACFQSCPALTNQTECVASPFKCLWRGGKCSSPPPCSGIKDEPACAASAFKCLWSSEEQRCQTTMCNFNGVWNMTFPFGNPAGVAGGGMHFADMHIFQPPGSMNYSMEWRTGHCVLPDCYKGRARATGWMRSNVSMQTKPGTAHHMWGVNDLGYGSVSPFPSELDKSLAPDCSLLTFPDALFEGKMVRWCKKPYCPLDSPPASLDI